jgi:hypothetical protein
MQIIFYKKDKVYRIINTDMCADFRNENSEITYQHGNYRHTMSTEEIGNTQEILDYIAYCLRQKREICEVPSKDYEDWKSRLYIDKEEVLKALGAINNIPVTILKNEKDYVLTYHGIPVEELVKGFDKYLIDKEYERITEDLAKIDFINPISPEEIKKIKEQEKREEAIKRAIAKAYLFDKKNKK